MTSKPPTNVPAGWYRDPDQVNTQRYWTGSAWTDQRAPMAPPRREPTGLMIGGVITAIAIPVIGFVIGVVLITKHSQVAAGVGVLILSLISGSIWFDHLSQPAVTSYGYCFVPPPSWRLDAS
jgi:hypothetical protein